MIASLKSETPQNAERGIETGIPFGVDSRISTHKRGVWMIRLEHDRVVSIPVKAPLADVFGSQRMVSHPRQPLGKSPNAWRGANSFRQD